MIYKESAKGKTSSTHSECKTDNSHKPIRSVAGYNNAGTLAKEGYKQRNDKTDFQLSAVNQKSNNPHSKNYCKSPIKLPGVYLIQTHLRGSLIETGDLFNFAKTMVSVLHKELDYKVEKLK